MNELGVDELFTQLISTTQPKYRMNRVYEQCDESNNDASTVSAECPMPG